MSDSLIDPTGDLTGGSTNGADLSNAGNVSQSDASTAGIKTERGGLDEEEEDDDDRKPGRERRKIEIKFIQDKSRRHITFSKRKAGIMKKAYELSVLTGTQVLLLVVSETGLVYTFTTPKLQPLVTKPEGKNLIQACLNAPEESSSQLPLGSAPGGGGGQGPIPQSQQQQQQPQGQSQVQPGQGPPQVHQQHQSVLPGQQGEPQVNDLMSQPPGVLDDSHQLAQANQLRAASVAAMQQQGMPYMSPDQYSHYLGMNSAPPPPQQRYMPPQHQHLQSHQHQ